MTVVTTDIIRTVVTTDTLITAVTIDKSRNRVAKVAKRQKMSSNLNFDFKNFQIFYINSFSHIML